MNTDSPEKRFRVLRSQKEVSKLPDESDNIFRRNMLERYLDGRDQSFCNGKFTILNTILKLCFAECLRFCYIKPSENDWQPIELKGDLPEVNARIIDLPVIMLMSSKKNEI